MLSALTYQKISDHQVDLGLSTVTQNRQEWYPHAYRSSARGGQLLADRKIWVIGNSHAPAYSTMLQMAADRHGLQYTVLSPPACPMGSMLVPVGDQPDCRERIEQLMQRISRELRPGDAVFFASLRMPRIMDQWSFIRYSRSEERGAVSQASLRGAVFEWESMLKHVQRQQDRYGLAMRETADLVARLKEMEILVLIDAPKPVMQMPPFRCSDWFNRSNPICARGSEVNKTQLLEMREPVMRSLHSLQEKYPNLMIWDPFPILCPDELCSAYDNANALPLYFDGDHLSAHGNRVLYPDFERMLRRLFADEFTPGPHGSPPE